MDHRDNYQSYSIQINDIIYFSNFEKFSGLRPFSINIKFKSLLPFFKKFLKNFIQLITFVKIDLIATISLSEVNRSAICLVPLSRSVFSLFLFNLSNTLLFFFYSLVNFVKSKRSIFLQVFIIVSTLMSGHQNSKGRRLPFTLTMSIRRKFYWHLGVNIL